MDSQPGSVSDLLQQVQAGRAEATAALWARLYDGLVRLARSRLRGRAPRDYDEEDIAHSVLEEFLTAKAAGRLDSVEDREHLWHLLARNTSRKLIHRHRMATAEKRGGGRVRGDSWFLDAGGDHRGGFEEVAGCAPLPEYDLLLADELARLDDDVMRAIALRTLEGYSQTEIAAELGCTAVAVHRKLKRIRTIWKEDLT